MRNSASLIFTVYNEENGIIKFCDSLVQQTITPTEIVVVDGGSTDNTVKILNDRLGGFFGESLRVIVDKNCSKKFSKGPIAKGRNVAISNTTRENIIVTDAGCILDKNWFEEILNGFEQGAQIVSGNYKAITDNSFQEYISDVFCQGNDETSEKYPQKFEPSSRSFGFKKSLWEIVGGYPENTYTAEDTKFVRLLFEQSESIFLAKKAIVYWDVPKDFSELKSKVFSYGVGDGQQRLDELKYLLRFAFLLLFPLNLVILLFFKRKLISIPIYYYQVIGFVKGRFFND